MLFRLLLIFEYGYEGILVSVYGSFFFLAHVSFLFFLVVSVLIPPIRRCDYLFLSVSTKSMFMFMLVSMFLRVMKSESWFEIENVK
jgi:hypothetical protein